MDLTNLSDADLAALQSGDLSKLSDEGLAHLSSAPVAPPARGSILDAPNALASGFDRGLVRYAGLPVDVLANVVDLGKAAIGAPYTAITGKPAPDALMPLDRSKVIGSGDWLLKQAGKNKVTSAVVNPANTDYEGGYLQAIGGGMALATNPMQAALGAASAVAGKGVYDATGSEAAAITASMLPAATPTAASMATKHAIRGGEQGRQEMIRRVDTLRRAGVARPTLGLASGNQALGGVETVLQTIPGSMGTFQRARDAASAGMQDTATRAADLSGATRGRLPAGAAVQRDLRDFHARHVAPGYARVNELAEGVIGTQTPVQVENAIATAERLSTPNPGAPQTSSTMMQPRIGEWLTSLRTDAGGTPARTDAAGMTYPAVPPTGIPYGVVKALRTSMGEEAASLDNVGRPAQRQIRAMYGGLSRDMEGAAAQADLAGGRILQTHLPTSASGALRRANRLYSAGLAREEATAPFANNPTPELAFDAVARTPARAVSVLQAIKKSVTPETRGSVAATVIDDLGTASAGHQTHTGDAFSPATFLTNWNKLTPEGQRELFSGYPNAAQAHAQVSAIAEAADMMRVNSRHWANPSGTAANTSGREMMRGLGLGIPAAAAGLGSWLVPAGVIGTVGGARGASNLMTSPRVVDWATRRTPDLSDREIGALSKFLLTSGVLDEANDGLSR